ncbi:hypothetical protein M885DRAFT_620847 [Pelagophyceae sp. CCMP2097]|nr:hypothetical protein M885DRAFT_620847 [Pelagophyceae sp. CCMP2097]
MVAETAAASARLMEHMSIFASETQIKALLSEYMRRVVLQQPADPVQFLIDEITRNPFHPPALTKADDRRSAAEQMACLDLRPVQLKTQLLRGLFDAFEKDGLVDRGALLVAFNENPTLLLTKFPRHASDLPRCIEALAADAKGCLDWGTFSEALLQCVNAPGSSPGA